MKTGKITAKLRDAVPVCLMVNGEEVKRYKNIELPDAIKEIDMKDFHFYIPMDGKITFQIHYEEGILPEVFPEPRSKMSRTKKAAMRAAAKETEKTELTEAPEPEPQTASESQLEPEETLENNGKADGEVIAENVEADGMEIAYHVSGSRRKELVVAVGDFIGAKPEYLRAPTYGFAVGSYNIDKEGTLTGPENPALIESLTEQGFVAVD